MRAGARAVLPAAESRHVRVLRLAPGDTIVVFDGASDVEWRAEIVAIPAKGGVELRLDAPVAADRELAVRVTLAVAMPANDRMDFLVEKATELGAFALQPLIAARSVLRLAGARAAARRLHWQGVATAASEQCGRTRVPDIALPMPLDAWLSGCAPSGGAARSEGDRADHGAGVVVTREPASGLRVVLSLDGGARPLDAVVADAVAAGRGIVVLSGPEGGFDRAEGSAAHAAGFVAASLGPRVLRADTAPLAALQTIVTVVAMASSAEMRTSRP